MLASADLGDDAREVLRAALDRSQHQPARTAAWTLRDAIDAVLPGR